jgi:hypothetical protein
MAVAYGHPVVRKVIASFAVVFVLTATWLIWPAFGDAPNLGCTTAYDGTQGYDLLTREWRCGDNWVVRFGRFGIEWV